MKASDKGTFVSILDKEFCINCPPDKEVTLKNAASYLDKQMRQIRKTGRVIGLERIAVMAALNITHELLALKENRENRVADFSDRIKLLQSKIDEALHKDLKRDEVEQNENLSMSAAVDNNPALSALSFPENTINAQVMEAETV